MIHVVGGCYLEICMSPEISQFYGSGGRAATALADRVAVTLHTGQGPGRERELKRLAALGGFNLEVTPVPIDGTFGYVHPLQSSQINPARGSFDRTTRVTLHAPGEVALVFGMYEAQPVVTAGTIIYDPQDGAVPVPYHQTQCRALDRLAILMNAGEALTWTNAASLEDAGLQLLRDNRASVVIIKAGPRGALVFQSGSASPVSVPAFRSSAMFGIGSGDIFAAAFTYYWGERGDPPEEAAIRASRSVSHYVETRSDRLATDTELGVDRDPVSITPGSVYLAGPFFTMAQRWLVEEAKDQLLQLGLDVFSPLHQVGRGPAEDVAMADLEGLERCDRVFAILDGGDPGTMFEVGYARKMGIPVYAYAETVDPENSKMVTGSGCMLTADFATAIYQTAWRI